MRKKKLIILFACMGLAISVFTGCNTSKKANKAAESTTEEEVKDRTVTSDELLKALDFKIDDCVTLPKDYMKTTIDLENKIKYDDEGFNQYVNGILMSYPEYKESKEDTVKKDSIVGINLTQTIEGEAPNSFGDDYKLAMGENYLPENADEKLIGKKVGEEYDFDITFTDQYGDELKGKKCNFKGKINKIYKKEDITLDKLTDKYVKDNLSEPYQCETVKEFKKKMKEEYDDYLKSMKEDSTREKFIDFLIKNSKVTVPKDYLKKSVDKEIDAIKKDAKENKSSYEEYLKNYYGSSEKDLKRNIEDALKTSMIYDALIKDQNFTISYKEFRNELNIVANGEDINKIYDNFGGEDKTMLVYAESKVLDDIIPKIKTVN